MEKQNKELYKFRKISACNQNYRREANLKRQNEQRDAIISKLRSILSPLASSEPVDQLQHSYQSNNNKIYQNKIMLSEWFVDIPSDIKEKWMMLLCPVGKRCLLIARKNRTFLYSKNGSCFKTFECPIFPGGSHYGNPLKNLTILDCIFNKVSCSLFVLDVIVWNGLYLIDCHAEMRIFFIQSRLYDYFQVENRNNNNTTFPYCDVNVCLLPKPCIGLDSCTISNYLNSYSNELYNIDGVLFYHKESFYYCGQRVPLVGWLKISMLSLLFNISHIPIIFLKNNDGIPTFNNLDELKKWLMCENKKLYNQNNKQTNDSQETEAVLLNGNQ